MDRRESFLRREEKDLRRRRGRGWKEEMSWERWKREWRR